MPITSSVSSRRFLSVCSVGLRRLACGRLAFVTVSFLIVASLSSLYSPSACAQVRPGIEKSPIRFEVAVDKYIMGTLVEATVMYSDVPAAQRALVDAFMEMQRIEALMSVNKPDSEISRLNREAASHPVRTSGEVLDILSRSIDFCHRSNGLFDITVGPLSELWGFSGDDPVVVPDSEAVLSLQRLTGCERVSINWTDSTVSFSDPGVEVDLGGIAKGYAVDRATAVLRARGINDFIVNAGGDLYASGEKEPGVPWRIGIKHPRKTDGLIARMDARDQAVVTSGDYERFVIVNGRRYHHILDPRTGFPATSSQSVTVVAKSAEAADAWATYLFVAGKEASEGDGPERLRVAADGTVSLSGNIGALNSVEVLE